MSRKYRKLIALCYLIAFLLAANIILWESRFMSLTTYAITNGQDPICYVKGKNAAEEVIQDVYEEYAGGAEIKAATSNLEVRKASAIKTSSRPKKAAKEIMASDKAEVKISAVESGTKDYVPEPVIEQDDELLAGQSEIKEEGNPGKQEYTTSTVIVNGVVQQA